MYELYDHEVAKILFVRVLRESPHADTEDIL